MILLANVGRETPCSNTILKPSVSKVQCLIINEYATKHTPVQAMSSQFLEENAVGNCVKSLAEVKVDHIHSLSFIHPACHLIRFIKQDLPSINPC